MVVVGYGTNTDVDHLPFAVYDQDQTPESRTYVDQYRGSPYFQERAPITDAEGFQQRLASGELMVALDIPAGFGRDVRRGRPADAGAWVDGAMPFRAETAQGYLQGLQQLYLDDLAASQGRHAASPVTVNPRFRYNQGFESVKSLIPTTMALLLALTPATLVKSMPQLGLLFMSVFLPMHVLSGGNTPLASEPRVLQVIMQGVASTHFVSFAEAILFRGAGLGLVYRDYLAVAGLGAAFFLLSALRFRSSAAVPSA